MGHCPTSSWQAAGAAAGSVAAARRCASTQRWGRNVQVARQRDHSEVGCAEAQQQNERHCKQQPGQPAGRRQVSGAFLRHSGPPRSFRRTGSPHKAGLQPRSDRSAPAKPLTYAG